MELATDVNRQKPLLMQAIADLRASISDVSAFAEPGALKVEALRLLRQRLVGCVVLKEQLEADSAVAELAVSRNDVSGTAA